MLGDPDAAHDEPFGRSRYTAGGGVGDEQQQPAACCCDGHPAWTAKYCTPSRTKTPIPERHHHRYEAQGLDECPGHAQARWRREGAGRVGISSHAPQPDRWAAQPARPAFALPGAADKTATSPFLGTRRPGPVIPEFPRKACLPTRGLVDVQPAAAQLVQEGDHGVVGEEGAVVDSRELRQHQGGRDLGVAPDLRAQDAEPQRSQQRGAEGKR